MQKSHLKELARLLPVICFIMISLSCTRERKVYFNEAEFRDKVYACWLGKNIGGTLGIPFEGDTNVHELTYYTKLKEGEPAANDDLDLQILWLKAMQENNAHVDAYKLGEYWLKYVPVNWNEYGIGKANMRTGLKPPVSGEFNNGKWKHSNGAWIRSEIWACLFPGNPLMAARLAREDACVDHGMAEGTYAEIFSASVESAAFLIHERDTLINFGLTMIPSDCRVSRAVRTAIRAREEGKTWKEARAEVIRDTEDMGWFQAPRNVAFTIIGWLYGDGDFGKSICIAVGCGDDTDCTGATLGSILGIIHGTAIIPEEWRKPIGNRIVTVAISGFEAPATLDVLTDSTIAMTRRVISKYELPLELGTGETKIQSVRLPEIDRNELEKLWTLSPWRVTKHNSGWVITLDYLGEPVISEGTARKIDVSVTNKGKEDAVCGLYINGIPAGWNISGLLADTTAVKTDEKKIFNLSITPGAAFPDTIRMELLMTIGSAYDTIPFTLFKKKI
jgi:ADP-ribosylglycohydrolase